MASWIFHNELLSPHALPRVRIISLLDGLKPFQMGYPIHVVCVDDPLFSLKGLARSPHADGSRFSRIPRIFTASIKDFLQKSQGIFLWKTLAVPGAGQAPPKTHINQSQSKL